jgi:hypothetical protein
MTQTLETPTQNLYDPNLIKIAETQLNGLEIADNQIDIPNQVIFDLIGARMKYQNEDSLSIQTRVFGLEAGDKNYVLNSPIQSNTITAEAYVIKAILASRKNLD